MVNKGKNGKINSNGIMPAVNLISEGTEIQGEVKSNGDIRIDGTVSGTIHSTSKVVIGTTGKVEGEVYCQSADILGIMDGTIHVKDILFLKSSARIEGDISTGKLVVESGAIFDGNCNMGKKESAINGEKLERKAGQQSGQKATATIQ